jgi:lysophospholipase
MSFPPTDRRALPTGAVVDRWQAPDGYELRRFDWPAPAGARPRGSILFQGGRGDIFEKYLETFAHWHQLGWRVTSFDWRGQGGSGRLTDRPHVGHIDSFDHFIADIAAFWSEWAGSTPGPRVAMAHSMGGHLLLRALAEHVVTPDAAVLIAPMLGLNAPLGPGFGELLARVMGGIGDSARAAWKVNEKPYTTTSRQNLLTHDADRYADEIWWQQHDPSLNTGPPSWHWVSEAFASTLHLRESPALATVDVPVLMLVAEADKLVDPKAAVATAAKLPDVRLVRFGGESAHEILREADRVRDRALAEIDQFLAARAPQ